MTHTQLKKRKRLLEIGYPNQYPTWLCVSLATEPRPQIFPILFQPACARDPSARDWNPQGALTFGDSHIGVEAILLFLLLQLLGLHPK